MFVYNNIIMYAPDVTDCLSVKFTGKFMIVSTLYVLSRRVSPIVGNSFEQPVAGWARKVEAWWKQKPEILITPYGVLYLVRTYFTALGMRNARERRRRFKMF